MGDKKGGLDLRLNLADTNEAHSKQRGRIKES